MAYPYKPISWDKYYSSSTRVEHASVTSGLAAGITIGVFLTVFLLTFGCRLYNRRLDRRNSATSSQLSRRWHSVSDLFLCGAAPAQPPPPYEVAIKMPKPAEAEPPPFAESTDRSYSSPISSHSSGCPPSYSQAADSTAFK